MQFSEWQFRSEQWRNDKWIGGSPRCCAKGNAWVNFGDESDGSGGVMEPHLVVDEDGVLSSC